MINTCFKWLKAFLALGVKNIGFPIASMSKKCVEILDFLFFDFLDLDEFLTVLLTLLPLFPTTSLASAPNVFGANFLDDSVVFNIEVSGAAILLKPWMKRQ